MSAVVILGSAFETPTLGGHDLKPTVIETSEGPVTLHRLTEAPRPAYVLFRHGMPHRHLPHHIPWRAHAHALKAVSCDALMITSSVGVLTAELPLFQPLIITDLLMPDNRLPDGTACTVFHPAGPGQGHLVIDGGLCDLRLSDTVRRWAHEIGAPPTGEVVFAYVGGPRTKTAAENRFWAQAGAHVNSMTAGPELVMANELGIPTMAIGVGHKYSGPASKQSVDPMSLADSLTASRERLEALVLRFLRAAQPGPFGNHLYTFDDSASR